PLSTLDHLSEDLKPYILYQMTITIPNGSTAKRVEVYTRNESDKEKAIKILDKYKHIINHYWVYVSYSHDDASKEIKNLKIGSYKKTLKKYLTAVINHIKKEQSNDELYAFVVGFSPDHHDISVHWNSEKAFSKRIKEYQNKYPKYNKPENIESVKYSSGDFSFSTNETKIKEVDELYEILIAHQQLTEKLYKKHGEKFILVFPKIYKELMTNATISVIQDLKNEIKSLNTSEDFIYYMQYWDEAEFDQFNALQKTVSDEKIKKLMSHEFKDYLN
ncbi:MAG: DUF4303 domain-containing protein, partial [Lentisphaeria bacterium]|nr:DUF4303 domain-containing protein [Lentisphaeria bacterium]